MRGSGSRTARRPGVIALVLLGLLGLTSACAGTGHGVQPVELAELAADPDRYDGAVVRTEGVVRTFDDPFHLWIEDPALNRVELEPSESAQDLVGRRVEVEGTFRFADDRGRVIEPDRVAVVGEDPSA